MLQRYKLRLGDGTVLGVDHDALRTWAVDSKAMVQAAGTGAWYPLKEFLAQEHADALHATRLRARSRDRLPQGPAKPLPLVYPKPLPPADLKPLSFVYPKPRQDEPNPPSAPPAGEPLEPPSLNEPTEVQALAEEPTARPGGPPEPFPSPEVGTAIATLEARDQQVETPDLFLFSTSPAPVENTPLPDLASLQVLAEEPAVPPSVSSLPDLVESAVPAEPVEADVLEAPLGDRGKTATEQNWIPDDGLSPILPPLDDGGEVTDDPAFFEPLDPVESPSPGKPVGVQALADEPVLPDARPASSQPPAGEEILPIEVEPRYDELPMIPLRPLRDETPAGLGVYEEAEGRIFDEAPPRSELEENLMGLAAAYDALLTRWIERLRRRPSSTSPAPAAPEPPNLYRKASAWLDDLTEGVARLARPDRSSSPVLPNVPPASKALGLVSPPPSEPPLPVSQLPVLRFADIPEEKEEGDVYQGEGESRPHTAWRWTKRIAVTSGLLAGGLFAALTWETWVPKAEQLARAGFTEVDRFNQAERQRQALREATEQLPHLAGTTIQLILATSPTGVLDPPEVFRLASDAEDRGLSALTAGEAQELKELRGELLSSLRPSERERVREYDEARARRVVFPVEDRDIAGLFARGGYDLPSESRGRLQELLGKAIAAGLVPPDEATKH
jgi:hypothetical protein